jgi:DNA polymerase III alpha subunit
MGEILPLFKSQYSLGRSILTLEKPEDALMNGPDSIVDIAEKNGLEEVTLIEDSITGFLQAYKNFSEKNIKLIFGLRMTLCPDLEEKSEDSINSSCKYMILSKNTKGYEKLIKISSHAAKEGFYYEPRADFKLLKKYWSDKDLVLVVPFYDSFLFYNTLTTRVCLPQFEFTEPVFLEENNSLPFDDAVRSSVMSFTKNGVSHAIVKAQSIFYRAKNDFKSYLTFRCINNRSSLERPNLDHMGSNEFCFDSWKEKNEKA